MAGVPHFFISSRSLKNPVNAAQYAAEARNLVKTLFEENDIIIMAGGSGLYLSAFLMTLSTIPGAHPNIRENLNRALKTQGVEFLAQLLRCYDPDYYRVVDLKNPHRIIRGLEVSMQSGMPYSEMINAADVDTDFFNFLGIHLTAERSELERRISLRTENMLKKGLISEVESIIELNLTPPLQSIGYDEILLYLKGEISLQEATARINLNTLNYAKRQVTWFRKKGYVEFSQQRIGELLDYIVDQLNIQK